MQLLTDISDTLKNITDIELKNEKINNGISILTEQRDSLSSYKDYNDSILSLNNEINKMTQEIHDKYIILNNITELNNETKSYKNEINNINWEINKINGELLNLKIKLKDFISLNKEQTILNEKFDDINIIRESLSSNKGIPLLYMQLFLKNTKIFVNELLKIVYADNFEIDDFDINESEFNIPYIKNNIRISDVMYASQGEKSFLSLALSFALINQSIRDYNILLLDEIDSTLDTRNRAMFLNILEKQMESINSEQIFLITHNNMFENYPVDIILTSKNKVSNFNNANILFSV